MTTGIDRVMQHLVLRAAVGTFAEDGVLVGAHPDNLQAALFALSTASAHTSSPFWFSAA